MRYHRIESRLSSFFAGQIILLLSFKSSPLEAVDTLSSKISKDEVQLILEQSPFSEFPMELTQPVMDRLNFLLAQPEQTAGVKEELTRMEKYQDIVLPELERSGLPAELAAIPLVETGYRNHPRHKNGTGLWMLTKDTARAYDLVVNRTQDERMNPHKATETAVRILKDYYERFGDWLLALAAYNQGPTHVARVIRETEVSDVWKLMNEGHINNYAAKVIAAAILIEHQEALLRET